jgi:hypothetical protein
LWAWLKNPLVHVAGYSLAATVFLLCFVRTGKDFPDGPAMLVSFGWSLMVLCWMEADARRRRRLPCFDFGFLMGLAFPVSAVWYCIHSRGWGWGTLLLLALVSLLLLPQYAAVCFALLRYALALLAR